jgi:Fe-only nitrogenase accessory protein AnfO
MAKEIAVFLGNDGMSAPIDGPGKVVVFRRALGSWEPVREMGFSIGSSSMRELRYKMSGLLEFMEGCRVFIARSITGVPYFELEKAGCGIWEYSGSPESYLERVWNEEENEQATPKASPVDFSPQEKTPGNYFISIKEIQRNMPEITSKQALQQFIRKGDFRTLEIECSHVPPWIEMEAEGCGLVYEIAQPGVNDFLVKIEKKQ